MNQNVYQPPTDFGPAASPGGYFPNYQPLQLLVRLIALGLAAYALISLGLLAIHVWTVSLTHQVSPGGINPRALEMAHALKALASSLRSLCFYGAAIACFVFLHRASHNARVLGAQGMEYSPGWTIGWFFIPIAWWFKPYAAVKELWEASGPGGDEAQTTSIVLSWWACWLFINIGGLAVGLMSSSRTPDDIAARAVGEALLSVGSVVGAYFAYRVFNGIHQRQQERAARLLAG